MNDPMSDLVSLLNSREKEIGAWLIEANNERDRLAVRLAELDENIDCAQRDRDRVRRAAHALESDDEQVAMKEALSELVPKPDRLAGRAAASYAPGR